jgi:hypothetical protein
MPYCVMFVPFGIRTYSCEGQMDFKSLAPNCCWFESQQGFLILSCGEAFQLAYGMLLRCPFMLEIMHRRAPEVSLKIISSCVELYHAYHIMLSSLCHIVSCTGILYHVYYVLLYHVCHTYSILSCLLHHIMLCHFVCCHFITTNIVLCHV